MLDEKTFLQQQLLDHIHSIVDLRDALDPILEDMMEIQNDPDSVRAQFDACMQRYNDAVQAVDAAKLSLASFILSNVDSITFK